MLSSNSARASKLIGGKPSSRRAYLSTRVRIQGPQPHQSGSVKGPLSGSSKRDHPGDSSSIIPRLEACVLHGRLLDGGEAARIAALVRDHVRAELLVAGRPVVVEDALVAGRSEGNQKAIRRQSTSNQKAIICNQKAIVMQSEGNQKATRRQSEGDQEIRRRLPGSPCPGSHRPCGEGRGGGVGHPPL